MVLSHWTSGTGLRLLSRYLPKVVDVSLGCSGPGLDLQQVTLGPELLHGELQSLLSMTDLHRLSYALRGEAVDL